MKFAFALAGLQATSGFFLPNPIPHHSSPLKVTPDQWLGYSPSDHYGGAVGPKFEAFLEEEVETAVAVDEAALGQEFEKQQKDLSVMNETYPSKQEPSRIAPLSWDGGTMEAGFVKAQKQNAYGGGAAPFVSKGGFDYKTEIPRQATPPGAPKMIGFEAAPSPPIIQQSEPAASFYEPKQAETESFQDDLGCRSGSRECGRVCHSIASHGRLAASYLSIHPRSTRRLVLPRCSNQQATSFLASSKLRPKFRWCSAIKGRWSGDGATSCCKKTALDRRWSGKGGYYTSFRTD